MDLEFSGAALFPLPSKDSYFKVSGPTDPIIYGFGAILMLRGLLSFLEAWTLRVVTKDFVRLLKILRLRLRAFAFVRGVGPSGGSGIQSFRLKVARDSGLINPINPKP